MKKLILAVAAATVVASTFAAAPLGSTWGVQPLPTDGFHGSLGGGANELVGYQVGPVFSANGLFQGSYGFQNGMVVYGSVYGERSFDALAGTPMTGITSRTGDNINSLFITAGTQKQLTPNLLVGAQMTYGNYALAPSSSTLTVNTPGTSETADYTLNEVSGVDEANSLVNFVNSHFGTSIAAVTDEYDWFYTAQPAILNAFSEHYYGMTAHELAISDNAAYQAFFSEQQSITTTGFYSSQKLNFKTVGFGFNPYAQYTFGQSTVYGSYTLQELQNSGMQTLLNYAGSGVGNTFNGGYSYAMSSDLTVGISGAYQIVNQPYTYASLVKYANSNNYQAAIGSEDYISIMPGVNYNISAIQGLSVGLNTGLNWFNFRKCNAPANGYANFMSAFVFTPSVNYQIPLAQNFVWSSNAQYNGVKMINASNPETGASMNGQTLNSSFQVTTGLTYSF